MMQQELKRKELYHLDYYDNLSDAFIERYKDFMNNPTVQQEQFARDMIDLILNNVDTSKVTAIAGRCGISKSILVQSLISYFTRHDNYDFRHKDTVKMIVVTDMLERLRKYQNSPENPQSIWCVDNYYKLKHDKFCTYISSDNDEKTALELLIESRYKPIVLLTTQRYFNMPDEQREMLFEYQYGKGDKKQVFNREIVIFDEKPEFYSCKIINVKNLNLCAAALQEGIPKSDGNKDWILQEYRAFRNKMEIILREKEKEKINKPTDRFYWRDVNSRNMTTDDDRFFELITRYRKRICKEYQDAFTDLRAFKQLMQEGAFFITVSKKSNEGQEYKTYFQLYQDNRNKFYLGENKAKFFIMDATADIDPDYGLDYIEKIDCAKYNININMKIHHTDVGTSRTQIVNGKYKDYLISAINKTMQNINKNSFNSMLAITYQDIENSFRNKNVKTAHFGGVKGLNNHVGTTKMSHIGLNRQSDFDYFIKLISLKPEILNRLKQMNENRSRDFIEKTIGLSKGLFLDDSLNVLMNKSLLADFEQNIFRTKIRDYQNTDRVEIYTYWNCEMFSALNTLIEKRYSKYGVEIEYVGVPVAIEKMKTQTRKSKDGEDTDAQKIIKWHSMQEKGIVIKRSKLLDELAVDRKNFERLMKNNNAISNLFEKGDKQGYYIVA